MTTSVKIKFRPSTVAGKEGTVYYQIIHNRMTRHLLTDCKIFPSEWDERRQRVATNIRTVRRPLLLAISERLRQGAERLAKIARHLDDKNVDYTTEELIEEYERHLEEYSLFAYTQSVIAFMADRGRITTSRNYQAALNSFRAFRQGEDVMLDAVDANLIESYEAHLRGKGVAPNTSSFYLRILRAVYNRAVDQEIIERRNPFRRVYTGVDKTTKRALPLPAIRRIKDFDTGTDRAAGFARDMFMLAFYLRGMSFVDMAYLRKTDLKNGYVTYRRRKTGQSLTIAWTEEMQAIVDKYPKNPTQYLLPIITNPSANHFNQYRNVGYNINLALKRLAREAGIAAPLTMYVARHSWASIAKAQGIPISVISEGMGHDSETTTLIYLASLDVSAVDRANSKILKALR